MLKNRCCQPVLLSGLDERLTLKEEGEKTIVAPLHFGRPHTIVEAVQGRRHEAKVLAAREVVRR